MSHRAGRLKQSNKPFRGDSKRKLKKKGKKVIQRESIKKGAVIDKKSRINKRNAKRKQKRENALYNQRIGTNHGPPKVVGILSLGEHVNSMELRNRLLHCIELGPDQKLMHTVNVKKHKKRLTFLDIQRNKRSVLDAGKVCDLIILAISMQEGTDDDGDLFLNLLRAQGFPTSLLVIDHEFTVKKKKVRKLFLNDIKREFPQEPKMFSISEKRDNFGVLMRMILETTTTTSKWRDMRPYLLVQSCKFVEKTKEELEEDKKKGVSEDYKKKMSELGIDIESESEKGYLEVSGYLRGSPLSPNQLIHIVNIGTFKLSHIQVLDDPHRKSKKKNVDEEQMMEGEKMFYPSDEKQRDLVEYIEKDPFLAEPGNFHDEFNHLAEENEYIDRYDDEEIDDDDDEIKGKTEKKGNDDDIDPELEKPEEVEEVDLTMEYKAEDDTTTVLDPDFNISKQEDLSDDQIRAQEEHYNELIKQYAKDRDFKDIVKCPEDTTARMRYSKYRGLKSFRNSPWDPYEQLPFTYSKIFHLKNYSHVNRAFQKKSGVPSLRNVVEVDNYIKIRIKDVPKDITQKFNARKYLMIIIGLLQYEQKLSVTNFALKRVILENEDGEKIKEEPIKSGTEMHVQIGFRMYNCKPIFSEHDLRLDKYKLCRFIHPNTFYVGTIFSHITFGQAPVLVFQQNKKTGKTELVAKGYLMNCDPLRVVLKKISLVGHIFRTNKRKCVVRYMFRNPDDVNWFKPIELRSTSGKRGVIIESLGTKGYMKCYFEDMVQQNQIVLMNLYKRIFPNWGSKFVSFL